MTENFRELRPTFQHTSLHAGSAHTRHPARLRALLSAPPSQAYFLLINQLSPRRRAWPELPSQGARAELSALKRQASTSLERKSEHTAGQGAALSHSCAASTGPRTKAPSLSRALRERETIPTSYARLLFNSFNYEQAYQLPAITNRCLTSR